MYQLKNIYLLGTSHIAKESIKQVHEVIDKLNPEIVALELDPGRAYALKNKVKRPKNLDLIKMLGIKGFLFYFFAEIIQKNLGKVVDIEPGSEMLAALKAAEAKNLMIFLIDRDIQITLSRFSRHFRKREIFRMLGDIISGIFRREKYSIDISKVPAEELISTVLGETKKRYPSLYKVLIDERDIHMAKSLHQISQLYPDKKIFAVVGAGHIKGILRYMDELFKNDVKIG